MKKLLIVLLFVFIFSLVVALEAPDAGVGSEDVEAIQEVIEDYSPLDEEGNVDISKYKPFKSKAEERVENINLWLEENASWLSAIFGMVPALSWLFAINLYLIILYLVILVFNGEGLSGLFSVLDKNIDLMFFETRWANIAGFILFMGLIATKALVLLAEFLLELFGILWNYILPWGLFISVIIIILIVIGGLAGIVVCRKILIAIGQAIKKIKDKKKRQKNESNMEVIEKIVKGATNE